VESRGTAPPRRTFADALRAAARSWSPRSYEARLVFSALVAGGLARWVHLSPLWAIISAILVLQPDPAATRRATLVRFVATVIGAGSAVGAVALGLGTMAGLALALVITCTACAALDLEEGLRAACVCAAVLLIQPGPQQPEVEELKLALARILALLGGAAVALLVAHLPGGRPTATE
jgi:uncharacterized membrane protein YgaE (UPF0421/DUF939 family)